MPREYHERFRNFHSRTLDATDRLFRSRPWVDTENATSTEKFERWLRRVSAAYDLPVPDLAFSDDPRVSFVFGCYRPSEQRIYLPKHSVVTLFHEFRHHMQHRGADMVSQDVEEDARAWSLSLFYQVRPSLYWRAVEDGGVLHVELG